MVTAISLILFLFLNGAAGNDLVQKCLVRSLSYFFHLFSFFNVWGGCLVFFGHLMSLRYVV